MAISDLYFFDFDPKNSKFRFFSKIIAYKIRNFQFIQRTGIYVIEVTANNKHPKFQSNIFVIACAMAKKKTGKGDECFLIIHQHFDHGMVPIKFVIHTRIHILRMS